MLGEQGGVLKLPLVAFGIGAALLAGGFVATVEAAKVAGVFVLGGSYFGLLVRA